MINEDHYRMQEIFQRLYPKPQEFITPKRFFIREGDVEMFHHNKRRRVTRHIYLFNDRILVTRRKTGTFAKYSDWLKIDVSLRAREVDIEMMKTVSHNNEFRLHLPGKLTYIFYAISPEEREAWVSDINKSMKGEHVNPKEKKKEVQFKPKEKKEKEHKIVINENSEESSDDDKATKAKKNRDKIDRRIQTEIVTTRIRKPVQQAPANTQQETGDLLGFDPYAPVQKISPRTSGPVSKISPRNNIGRDYTNNPVPNTSPRTNNPVPKTSPRNNIGRDFTKKTAVSKVKPNKRKKIITEPILDNTRNPAPIAPNHFNLNSPGTYFSPFSPEIQAVPNQQAAPNPFAYPIQQNPGTITGQPFPNMTQVEFTGQPVLLNNPWMQPNSTFMDPSQTQGNIYFG